MKIRSRAVRAEAEGCLSPMSAYAALALVAAMMITPVVGLAQEGLPEGWISLDELTAAATPPSLEIASSDLNGLTLVVRTPGVVTKTVEHDGTEYREISFPSYYHTTEVGHPCIPAVSQLIAVPEGCEIEVSVSIGDSVKSQCWTVLNRQARLNATPMPLWCRKQESTRLYEAPSK